MSITLTYPPSVLRQMILQSSFCWGLAQGSMRSSRLAPQLLYHSNASSEEAAHVLKACTLRSVNHLFMILNSKAVRSDLWRPPGAALFLMHTTCRSSHAAGLLVSDAALCTSGISRCFKDGLDLSLCTGDWMVPPVPSEGRDLPGAI